MQLSANLSLAEVIRSETAKRIGVSNMPTPQHIENFKKLAANIFQPIREHFGKPILQLEILSKIFFWVHIYRGPSRFKHSGQFATPACRAPISR